MFSAEDHRRPAHAGGAGFKLFQHIAILAVVSYIVPLVAPLLLFGRLTRELASTENTQLASVIASVLALLIFRRVTSYPGVRAYSYMVPAFSTTFGLAATVLLVLRVPYSGPMLLTGYAASVAAGFLLALFDKREAGVFYYVPHGTLDIVEEVPSIRWVPLASPAVPQDTGACVVADLRGTHTAEWERMLAEAAISGLPVYHTKQLRESLTGRVQIEHLSENSFGSLIPALAYRGTKRVIDVVMTLFALPLLLLPMLVVACLVKFSSPGPVLFRQRRMGYRGVDFLMLKFRTMTASHQSADACEREAAITRSEDSRITPIGRFLRRSRIDELPQMINILRGEMSWIGPRPEAIPLSQWYEVELPFYRYRHIVRPGITGWAQVNQGHVAGLDDVELKLQYDFYYIKFFSFWLDVLIALRTVRIMLTGLGAK